MLPDEQLGGGEEHIHCPAKLITTSGASTQYQHGTCRREAASPGDDEPAKFGGLGHGEHPTALELGPAGVVLGRDDHLLALELGLAGASLGHGEHHLALRLGLAGVILGHVDPLVPPLFDPSDATEHGGLLALGLDLDGVFLGHGEHLVSLSQQHTGGLGLEDDKGHQILQWHLALYTAMGFRCRAWSELPWCTRP